jgi:hypothetical protein
VQYTYTISNTGSEDEVYDLALSAAWQASLSMTSVPIPAGESCQVVVSHTVPQGAVADASDSGTLTATSTRASGDATFTTTAEEERQPVAPTIKLFEVNDKSNRVWAWVTVNWAVADEDGDLATVQVVMSLDGTVVDSASFPVSGYEASGSCELRQRSGQGSSYEITLTVTDARGNTASQSYSISVNKKALPHSR